MAKNPSPETGVLKYDRRRRYEFVVQLKRCKQVGSGLEHHQFGGAQRN